MKITLHHVPNVDIEGGYWEPVTVKSKIVVTVPNLSVASKVLRSWVTRNGFGGGNMAEDCGKVEDGGQVIARVSYNGRVWGVDGKEIVI